MIPARSPAVSLDAGERTALSFGLATTDILAFSYEIKGWVPVQRQAGGIAHTGGWVIPDLGFPLPHLHPPPFLILRETSRSPCAQGPCPGAAGYQGEVLGELQPAAAMPLGQR